MRKLCKVRFLLAPNGSQTVIGRDWLRDLGIELKTEGGKCELKFVNESSIKLFTGFKELIFQGPEIKVTFEEKYMPEQQIVQTNTTPYFS